MPITERRRAEEALRQEKQTSERLLLNILPEVIANRLKQSPQTLADGFEEVTILFADLVNLTQLSNTLPPVELVELLNEIFSSFDALTDRYVLEKIKTMGDEYMVAGGLPVPCPNSAAAVVTMALEMRQSLSEIDRQHNTQLNIRIGINTDPAVWWLG